MLEAAAAREVREEAGVTVRIDALLGAYSDPGEPVVFIAYAGSIIDGTPRVAGQEVSAVELFSAEALPPLAFAHDGQVMAAWHAHRVAHGAQPEPDATTKATDA